MNFSQSSRISNTCLAIAIFLGAQTAFAEDPATIAEAKYTLKRATLGDVGVQVSYLAHLKEWAGASFFGQDAQGQPVLRFDAITKLYGEDIDSAFIRRELIGKDEKPAEGVLINNSTQKLHLLIRYKNGGSVQFTFYLDIQTILEHALNTKPHKELVYNPVTRQEEYVHRNKVENPAQILESLKSKLVACNHGTGPGYGTSQYPIECIDQGDDKTPASN